MEKEKMKNEALNRLEILNLHPDVYKTFKRSGRLYYSERSPLGGILYWLNNHPDKIKELALELTPEDFEQPFSMTAYQLETLVNDDYGAQILLDDYGIMPFDDFLRIVLKEDCSYKVVQCFDWHY